MTTSEAALRLTTDQQYSATVTGKRSAADVKTFNTKCICLGACEKLRKNCEKRLLASSCLSVRLSAWNNSARIGWILMKFDIWGFYENLLRKFKFYWNLTTMTGTLHADRYTFLIISRSVLPRMRNVSDKSCTENQNTHFVFSNIFFENRAVYEIIWKNLVFVSFISLLHKIAKSD